MASILQLDIPVFAGQGTSAASSLLTLEQAVRDARSASGSLLLHSCYDAFLTEISTLSPVELEQINVDFSDFSSPDTLLSIPSTRYPHNAILSGTTLFLIQSLRYLVFIETSSLTGSSAPFGDTLKGNAKHSLGVLGFSSGLLPACVVATSHSTISYICHAVEAYRLAFWLGVRTHAYRTTIFSACKTIDASLPWSLVLLGLSQEATQDALSEFQTMNLHWPSLNITAVMDDSSVTISGRPDVLAAFATTVPTGCIVHKTTVDTLYHSTAHATGVRMQVLNDVKRRAIRFPVFADIIVPIRSTFTAEIIDGHMQSKSLLELIVDMLLIQPVNWNLVVGELVQACPSDIPLRLLNVGPGAGLTRSLERAFSREGVSTLDLTSVGTQLTRGQSPKQEPIAIVGMAVNMPGAPCVSKLWELLEQGVNTVSAIPEHRFKVENYNNPRNPATKRVMKAHTGNFIDDADGFDNTFFRISPREARSMDPQQRVLLHTAYEALENAGYVPNATPSFQQDSFGCYIGVATHDYIQNLREDIDVYYSTGTLKAFLSGRLSYAMQLGGPSIVVDTACSSSVVAIYQACRALMNRDCNSALAGAVNIITSPDMFIGLDRGHFLSSTGQCKPFDSAADGYSRSEGCGIFVLKRLADAISENDNILGVIRGIEVNQSGLAHSITHPHAPTQAALFRKVLENSNFSANRINVVEAHGTGTQAGDPSEVESIRSVFALHRTPSNPLHITSIKANIGHLEAASGAAGLAKLLLMLRHRKIPRQISLKELNPKFAPLYVDNTIIDTTESVWAPSHSGATRVALLNNFGAAGSNGAILVEEHPFPSRSSPSAMTSLIFGLSAKNESALEELRLQDLEWIQNSTNEGIGISDIAYTATARRQLYAHRIAVSASSKRELIDKLHKAPSVLSTDDPGKIVFVFSGQGGQYLGMGASLYRTSPLFKHHIDECHNALVAAGFPGVLQIITAGSTGSGLSASAEFEAYQSAIFSLEFALAKLWLSWGVAPSAVVGHRSVRVSPESVKLTDILWSLGEYAALVIAGILSLKDALTIVANRVRLMVQLCAVESSGMIAVNLSPTAAMAALVSSNKASVLSIACFNSPVDCVIAGPLDQLKSFKAYMDGTTQCKSVILNVPFGYHSSAMQPILQDLTAVARRVVIRPPTIPIASTALGVVVMPGDATVFCAEYFALHCSRPVLFDDGIQGLATVPGLDKVAAWIELGPHPTSSSMIKPNAFFTENSLLLGSLRKQQDAWETLASSLCHLFLLNVHVVWREVFSHLSDLSCVGLPSYPFSKSKFWAEFNEPSGDPESTGKVNDARPLEKEYSVLYSRVQLPSGTNGRTAIFHTPIRYLATLICGHSVGGWPLCPASVYLELIFAGVDIAKRHLGLKFDDSHLVLREIKFCKPLVYDERMPRTVETTVTIDIDGSGTFDVSSRVDSMKEEHVIHVRGNIRFHATVKTATKFSRTLPVLNRQMSAVLHPHGEQLPETFSRRTAYEVIFPRVVEYRKEYHTIQSLTVDPSGMEGYAHVKLPSDYDQAKFVVHPVFMDTLLHVAGFVANLQGGVNDAYICCEVGCVKVIPEMVDNDASYVVYCRNVWLPDEGLTLAEAYAIQIAEPRKIVAHLKDMQFRRVRLSSLKRGLAHAAGTSSPPPADSSQESHPPTMLVRDIAPSRASSQGSVLDRSDIHATVVKIVSDACGINATLDVFADLSSLGIDSLMLIEVFGKLRATLPHLNLDAHSLSCCRTTAEIVTEISSRSSQGFSSVSSPRTLVPEEKSTDPTLFSMDEKPDVKSIIASVLGVDVNEIDDDTDFEAIGLDSLTSIEALQALSNEFGLNFPSDFFTVCATVRSARSYISGSSSTKTTHVALAGDQSDSRSIAAGLRLHPIPIPIQTSGMPSGLPLFLVHDGSGLVNYYDGLRPLNRNVWGIHNPKFIIGQPWDSLESMATVYADHILKTTSGPALLGGWSFGGVVAFEAARQLLRRGVAMKGVLLVDSPCPIDHVPLLDTLLESVINLDTRGSEVRRLVKVQFEMNSRLLGKYQPHGGPYPPIVLLRCSEGFRPSGLSDIPVWLSDRSDPQQVVADWERLVGKPVKVLNIPGHHFQPFKPSHIEEVSSRMADGCSYLESL